MAELTDRDREFLQRVVELSREYGVLLEHEDGQGGFEIRQRQHADEGYQAQIEGWLLAAHACDTPAELEAQAERRREVEREWERKYGSVSVRWRERLRDEALKP